MIAEAIADTALRYVEPAVPKSFAVNCGFSGLAKWRDELTDRKSKRGWPSMFAEGARAYAALYRAYEDIECRSTAGGRAFYADFLEEAAGLLGQDRLRRAAAEYREAATLWSRVADTIASCPDEAVRQACDIADRRVELNDAVDKATCAEAAGLWQQRNQAGGTLQAESRRGRHAIQGDGVAGRRHLADGDAGCRTVEALSQIPNPKSQLPKSPTPKRFGSWKLGVGSWDLGVDLLKRQKLNRVEIPNVRGWFVT